MTAGRDATWIAIGLLALLSWDASGLDMAVERWFGDAQGFSLKSHWFFAQVLHDGGRWVSAAAIVVVLINAFRPWGFVGPMNRATRIWWLAVTVICLVLIPTLKQLSATSCPWDLAEFGRSARHVSHWAFGVNDGGPGRCFPSGHASAAFSLFGGWFALRHTAPGAARRWLAGVWFFGVLFSVTQSVRGAHFPSHSMWTAWVCFTTSALLWHAAQPLLRPSGAER
ncbi:MAG: phosphatase PAP2 family protein [Burkholderiaceae bacterium]|nr:phosphatase PAP2 family protein [Burkholderiaceae bacterium]